MEPFWSCLSCLLVYSVKVCGIISVQLVTYIIQYMPKEYNYTCNILVHIS